MVTRKIIKDLILEGGDLTWRRRRLVGAPRCEKTRVATLNMICGVIWYIMSLW